MSVLYEIAFSFFTVHFVRYAWSSKVSFILWSEHWFFLVWNSLSRYWPTEICLPPSLPSFLPSFLLSLLVATGFPAGQTHLKTRLEEIRLAVEDGATEIDVVINRTLVLTGQWKGKCTCLPKKRLSYSLVSQMARIWKEAAWFGSHCSRLQVTRSEGEWRRKHN